MTGRIILKAKSKSGKEIVFRYVSIGDHEAITDYMNTISDEKIFISFQGEKLTYEDEKKFVIGEVKNIKEHKSVTILALHENKIIGMSGINLKVRVENHVGEFGITVAKDFRGDGIGKIFVKTMIEEAIKNCSGMKIVSLGVFSNNTVAISLYKKFGFIQHGCLPKGIKYKDSFVDRVEMYLNIEDYKM
jgi:RimJ/RimL family protein N-acetyltransferase